MTYHPDQDLHVVQVSIAYLQSFANEDACWHESPEDVEEGLSWRKQRPHLLRWVRREMGRKLTPRERLCLDLYYFEALTLREVGERTGTNSTSALRAIRRAVRKLRRAASESNLKPLTRRRRP